MNSNFAVQPPGVAEPIMAAMPQALQVGSFGMTEAAGTVCTGAWDEPEHSASRGSVARCRDSKSASSIPKPAATCRPACAARCSCAATRYSRATYKDPEKTAQALDADGWFHTGDIGSLDEAGTVMFHGRFKDMLKVGGENVAAAEIEGLLGRHPAVKLAQVVGIPDAKYVEVPCRVRRTDAGRRRRANASSSTSAARRSAGFKVPRVVRFVDEWPMSSSKIQKFRLRTALVDRTRPGLEGLRSSRQEHPE